MTKPIYTPNKLLTVNNTTNNTTDNTIDNTIDNTLSIIIIVKNRQVHLENTLLSIQSNSPFFSEVVLVHMNQPIQQHLETMVDYKLIQTTFYSTTEQLPLAKARNLGASLCTSSLLFFLDVDCALHPSACSEYLKASLFHPKDICMSKCLYLENSIENISTIHLEPSAEHPKRTLNTPLRWQLFWSLSFVIHKDWFNKLGRFDESFINYGGEDTELSYRNHLANQHLIWVPDAIVYHQPHENNELPLHHIHSVVANINYFYEKHGFYIMEDWIKGFEQLNLIKLVNKRYQLI